MRLTVTRFLVLVALIATPAVSIGAPLTPSHVAPAVLPEPESSTPQPFTAVGPGAPIRLLDADQRRQLASIDRDRVRGHRSLTALATLLPEMLGAPLRLFIRPAGASAGEGPARTVPLPPSVWLLCSAVVALLIFGRKRRQFQQPR